VELVTEWEGKVRRVAKEGENSSYRHQGIVFGQLKTEENKDRRLCFQLSFLILYIIENFEF